MTIATVDNITSHTIVRLRKDLGYTNTERNAMQPLEACPKVLVVACGKNQCMSKPYDQFEIVEHYTAQYHKAHSFEDHR